MKKINVFLIFYIFIISLSIVFLLYFKSSFSHTIVKIKKNNILYKNKNGKILEIVPKKYDEYKKLKITAVGDCTIGSDTNFGYTNSFFDFFDRNNGDYSYNLKNVKNIFEDDDITIANLEGNLTNANIKVEKAFNFKAPPDYVNILKEGNVEMVSFANNHAYDYGVEGYNETISTLDKALIEHYGYTNYLIKEINGIKVGFFAFLDIYGQRYQEVDKAIEYLKKQGCDIIIASMHWGIEKDYKQSNEQIKMGHHMIDKGVDLILGSHPHVIQGIEKYNGKYIVYSMANFAYGGHKNPSDKDTFIFQETFTLKNGILQLDDNIKIIPTSVSGVKNVNNYQPTPLEGEEKERVYNKIMQYSSGFDYKLN